MGKLVADEKKQCFIGWRLVLDRLFGVIAVVAMAYLIKMAIEMI